MGRIRQKFIKNKAFELVEEHDEFSGDFKKNKELLKDYAQVSNKKTRNKLAGYVTRVAKRRKAY